VCTVKRASERRSLCHNIGHKDEATDQTSRQPLCLACRPTTPGCVRWACLDAVRSSHPWMHLPGRPVLLRVVRQGDHSHREPVGRDRQRAELALHRHAAAVEDGSFRARPTIGFVEWADRWLGSLERKPSTVGSYRSTIVHAKSPGAARTQRQGLLLELTPNRPRLQRASSRSARMGSRPGYRGWTKIKNPTYWRRASEVNTRQRRRERRREASSLPSPTRDTYVRLS
jgi:hypothetical protein